MFAKYKDLLKEVGVDVSRQLEFQVYSDCFHGQHTPWTSESLVAKALQTRFQGKKPEQVVEVMKAYGLG